MNGWLAPGGTRSDDACAESAPLPAGDIARGDSLLLPAGDIARGDSLLLPAGDIARGDSLLLPAGDIARGVGRLLVQLGAAPLLELTLGSGHRADVAGLFPDGRIVLVEVKSSRQDFTSDRKWRAYPAFADLFYFAVASSFPHAILPADEGLILADRWGAEILREAIPRPLPAARRKAVQLRFARTAALRLAGVTDPLARA
jgi:hypothetical protein